MCRGVEQVLSVRWEYDDSSRIKTQAWQMGQQSYSESYTYSAKDGSLSSVSMNGGSLQLSYDVLSRLSTASNGVYTRNYTYRDISTSQTTTQVEKLRYTGLNGALSGLTYSYTYNPLGNIASVTSGGSTSSYTYDAMGQLTAASLPGMQYAYTYDGAGNLRTVTRGETTNTYTYGSASWKDLLTAFNGEKIVYEGQTMNEDGSVTGTPVSGNPIRYYNGTPWNFSWAEGRSLKTASSSTPEQDVALEFAYDADGLRIEKHVTKTVYEMTADHTYTDTVVAPTCTEAGYTLHECECGYSYTDTEVEALGHDFKRNRFGIWICSRCKLEKDSDPVITEPTTPSHFEPNTLDEPAEANVPTSDEPRNNTAIQSADQPLHRGAATEIEEIHQYIYAGGKLLRETITEGETTKTLDFTYDNVGMPYSLIYNNGTTTATYYYITNLQGDVMYLVDADGNEVAAYDYDPYSKIISATGDLAEINPLRYRGYYYDTETGFYYLQSRYYDPELCRFINADMTEYALSAAGNLLGSNLFSYCQGNPIAFADTNGEWIHLVIGAVVGAAIGGICAAVQGKSAAEIAIAAGAGALTGLLTSTGLGAVAQVAGGAVIAAGESLLSQGVTKGFDNINYAEVAYNGVAGGISGALGGVGKGASKHLWKQAANATSRVGKTLLKDGITEAAKETVKAGAYYFSQTSTLYYKPLITSAIKTVARGVQRTLIKTCILYAS